MRKYDPLDSALHVELVAEVRILKMRNKALKKACELLLDRVAKLTGTELKYKKRS